MPHVSGLLRPPCLTPAFQAAWSCIFKGFRNWLRGTFYPGLKSLKTSKTCKTSPLVSARACICRWPPCFSRPTGSILGLYYTAQPLPHRSGPSKLPGHVSLRRFETAKLPGQVSFASHLWPATASLPHSSLPRCLVMYL